MLLGRKMKYLRLPVQQIVLRRKPQGVRNALCACIQTRMYTNEKIKVIPTVFQIHPRSLCTTADPSDSGTAGSSPVIDYDNINETVLGVDDQDEDSYLRIQLYPEDPDVYLARLYEATTIQEIFDLVEEIDESQEQELTLRHCSQALATLWDLQKLMFKLGPLFDPSKEFIHRDQFVQDIRAHDIFRNKIVNPIVEGCQSLEDEPLAASLLCLKRMQFDVKGPECEKLVNECIKRKETLSLPAVSRVCVGMRSESLYGSFVQANFLPILLTECQSMETELDVRLISICIRNCQRVLSTKIIELYRERVDEILDKSEFETVTLCKVLLSLVDTKGVGEDPSVLLRKVGNKLADRVPKMALLDLLSLQRFVEAGSQEPFALMEALISRISRLIEESHPLRLDLLAIICGFMRNVYHHQKVFEILSTYMNTYADFETIVYMMYKVLRTTRYSDRAIYDSFWSKVLNLVTFETNNTKKVIRFAVDYINFVQGLGTSYRYSQIEGKIKKLLYFYFDNYFTQTQPTFFSPSDFARSFSFLLAFGSPQHVDDLIFQKMDYIESLDSLSGQLKIFDLTMIGRAVDIALQNNSQNKTATSKFYDYLLQICSILEEQISARLLHRPEDLSTLDLIACARAHTHIKKATRDSPIFQESMNIIAERGITDSRMGRDMANCLLATGGYNHPEIHLRMAEFIGKAKYDISPDVAEKFPIVAFVNGFDGTGHQQIFGMCSDIIRRHLEKLSPLGVLQSCLALCHYRSLAPELVDDIFSVDFIDEVDRGLRLTYGAVAAQMKVRHSFMELNRAVCIDMPNANVPWFHKKFCEEVISVAPSKEDYIHKEVQELLGDIFSESHVVQKNVYSPYYYLIDYLIEFDENNRPIKHQKRKSSFFSFQKPEPAAIAVAHDKVAILILPTNAYTKNVRALKGFYKLRERHLEILGCRLVSIDPQKWNSMCMSEPSVKSDFLESQIFRKESYNANVAQINKSSD